LAVDNVRVRSWIIGQLAADATLRAKTGGRIYRQGLVPENSPFPYVEVMALSDVPEQALPGARLAATLTAMVKVWGTNAKGVTPTPLTDLEAVMDRARAVLHGGTGTSGDVVIIECDYDGDIPLEPSRDDSGNVFDQLVARYRLLVRPV
jgi:hypothetical protein